MKTTYTIFIVLLILFSVQIKAQVGINTSDHKRSLDIVASNSVAPASTDGLLIPRIDAFPAVDPASKNWKVTVIE